MGTVIERLLLGLFDVLFEAFFTGTGRGLWGLFSLRPHDIVSLFSGMLFWGVIGVFAYGMMHG